MILIRAISFFVLSAFFVNTICPGYGWAQELNLPQPGTMISSSPSFNLPVLTGIKVYPDNPFKFDFILDTGDDVSLRGAPATKQSFLKEESNKLIKYFLASLTTPEKDLWVNLSPYEKNRIVPEGFGQTEMGMDLLAQDYILKQLTASLIYPEGATGKMFWKRVYEQAAKKFGTTNIPVNTFNKVWIVPEKAVVYENAKAGTAYIVKSSLKVMLEQDYLSLNKHMSLRGSEATEAISERTTKNDLNALGSQIVREVVIPQLTKEVNEGKNFAQLRQVYQSLILAAWYKRKIKDSILDKMYVDQNKTAGVNINDPQEKQKIYGQYLQAFKKGAYNYIKEETDPITQEIVPRKYFSGGTNFNMEGTDVLKITPNPNRAMLTRRALFLVTAGVLGAMAITALSGAAKASTRADQEIGNNKENLASTKQRGIGDSLEDVELIDVHPSGFPRSVRLFENKEYGYLFYSNDPLPGTGHRIIVQYTTIQDVSNPNSQAEKFYEVINKNGNGHYELKRIAKGEEIPHNVSYEAYPVVRDKLTWLLWIFKDSKGVSYQAKTGIQVQLPQVVQPKEGNKRFWVIYHVVDRRPVITLIPLPDNFPADNAMRVPALVGNPKTNDLGGIDFNTNRLNMELQNAGREITFHPDPAMLRQLQNAPGLTSFIINIQPLNDLRGWLGLNNVKGTQLAGNI